MMRFLAMAFPPKNGAELPPRAATRLLFQGLDALGRSRLLSPLLASALASRSVLKLKIAEVLHNE